MRIRVRTHNHIKKMKAKILTKTLVGILALGIPALSVAQDNRPGDRPEVKPVDPADRPERPDEPGDGPGDSLHPSKFAGRYVFAVVDTQAPAGTHTAGVGRMKVNNQGLFVMVIKNPSNGASGTLTGFVTRRGKLVFVPPLGENVRAAVRILSRRRCVTGMYGRYQIKIGPIVDPPPPDPEPLPPVAAADAEVDDGGNAVEVDPITRVPIVVKSGVVIGFRR